MSGSQNLLPTNTTLLQPGSGFFRLYDALWLALQGSDNSALGQQVNSVASQITSFQAQLADVNNQINSLQGQITALGTQIYDLTTAIGTINARLTAAGIP